ncbi:MAG: hypothetical protein ACFCU7_14885 [Pleurocapsa sp.]
MKRGLDKLPLVHLMKEQAYQTALDYHTQFLPQLDSLGTSILNTLRQEGTCIVPIKELDLVSTNAMMTKAQTLADELNNISNSLNQSENCEVGFAQNDYKELPEMLMWALESKLLDIVENYIGLPVLYQGYAMRRSIADGQYSGVRRWHIDWEDRRIIKIIIYLNDVAAGGGPYEYIPRTITSKAIKTLNYYNLGYLSDDEMRQAVLQKDWVACLASKGSVIITDTSSIFHRAQPPTEKERFSITFCYTSTSPLVVWKTPKISPQQWEIVNSKLNQRQINCLHKRKRS